MPHGIGTAYRTGLPPSRLKRFSYPQVDARRPADEEIEHALRRQETEPENPTDSERSERRGSVAGERLEDGRVQAAVGGQCVTGGERVMPLEVGQTAAGFL